MKRNLLLTAFSALLLGAAALPAAASECPGFLPPNDLKIPVNSVHAKGILEAQFNEVLNNIDRIYRPIIAAQGGTLKINRLWTDATVNASASQSGKTYILNMYGGLARHELITMDGFALVVCHELGHHIGGAPKGGWASIEGQADYYANLKCLRKVFADPGTIAFTHKASDNEVARKNCEAAFTGAQDREICVRAAMAGESVSYLFKALRKETVTPAFDTPDTSVVTTMMTAHPPTQCRMDTYLQGSICQQPVSAAVSSSNPAAGTCTRSASFPGGYRPLCWYKPANPAELLPPGLKTPDFDLENPATFTGPALSVLGGEVAW
ncbi:MAG: hypothetical protein HY952_09570 [Elusimicrobia bacterium]|nr:hypothetical protein [Elusimicrobiota bacterium]